MSEALEDAMLAVQKLYMPAREVAHAAFWELVDGDDLTDYPLAMAMDAFLVKLSETHAIVPREPTEAMISAAIALGVEVVSKDNPKRLTGGFAPVYRAMLKAAEPQPTSQR